LLVAILALVAVILGGFLFTVYFQLNALERTLKKTHEQVELFLKKQNEQQKKEG